MTIDKKKKLAGQAVLLITILFLIFGFGISYSYIENRIEHSKLRNEQETTKIEFRKQYVELKGAVIKNDNGIDEVKYNQLKTNRMLELLLESKGLEVPSRD